MPPNAINTAQGMPAMSVQKEVHRPFEPKADYIISNTENVGNLTLFHVGLSQNAELQTPGI
jgi:hypothetical protein